MRLQSARPLSLSGFNVSFGLEPLEKDKEIVKGQTRFLDKQTTKQEAQTAASEAKATLAAEKTNERSQQAKVAAAQAELDRAKAMSATIAEKAESKAFTEKAMVFVPIAVTAFIGIVTIAIFGRGK